MGRGAAITFKHKGDFKKTRNFLERAKKGDFYKHLEQYGEAGVEALSKATPIDTGLTAKSWRYKIERSKSGVTISWYNYNVNEGVNIALILQYGHGTPSGHYIRGKNYIKPAIKPIFKQIEESVWKEVTKD
jgi:hypothetical protein